MRPRCAPSRRAVDLGLAMGGRFAETLDGEREADPQRVEHVMTTNISPRTTSSSTESIVSPNST
jgi:hypothetical protein